MELDGTLAAQLDQLKSLKDSELGTLSAREEELLAPIREELSSIKGLYREVQDGCSNEVAELLEGATLADLSDPLSAAFIHAAYWNDGRGLDLDPYHWYRGIFPEGAYIFDADTLSYGEGDTYLIYLAPRVAIPDQKTQERLKLTADALIPVYFANQELIGDSARARIEIFDHGLSNYDSYSISYDSVSELWELSGRYSLLYSSDELVEVLAVAPTYQ